jgi:osmoprotectant transport system permease protein
VSVLADAVNIRTFGRGFAFIVENPGLLWSKVFEQLVLSGAAIGLALVLSIPIGIWLGHVHRGSLLAINVSNLGRALPSLAMISIGLGFLGLGFKNVLLALTVLAWPPMLTNAYVAVDGVEQNLIEAARGMGMTPLQILRKIELPVALPLIFAGIRTSAVYVVATGTLAAVAGGGGLGDIIFNQATYRFEGVIGASLVGVALAFAVEFAFAGLQWSVTPRGLRRRVPLLEQDVSTRGLAAELEAAH